MKIDGAKLPPQLRTRIGEATKLHDVSHDFFVEPQESANMKVIAIFFGACGVGAVVLAGVSRIAPVSGRYWSTPEIVMGLVGSFFAAWLVISQAIRIRALKRSEIKPAIVVSPLLVGETGVDDEPLHLHYLRDLVKPSFTHHHMNGSYQRTAVSLGFSTGTITFDITNRAKAERFLAFLKSTPEKLTQWHAGGQLAQKVEELDWIQAFTLHAAKEAEDAAPADPSKPRVRARAKYDSDDRIVGPLIPLWERQLLTTKGRMVAALAIAATVTTTSYVANLLVVEEANWGYAKRSNRPESFKEYFRAAPLKLHRADAERLLDDRTFELARDTKSANPLRAYRKDFPQGRHVDEAKVAIQEVYTAAEAQYRTHTAKAEPHAAEGMKALFAYMREEDAPLVRICFLPGKGIDGKALEADARRRTGSIKIHGVSGSFGADANKGREDRIVGIMTESFKKVLPQELFELKKGDPSESGPRFLVGYRVLGTGASYMQESEESLPSEQRQIWIGISIAFDFSLQVPGSKYPPGEDPAYGYRFEMTAEPAPNFDVRMGASPTEVYDRMVETAFQQFQVNLANSYGLELTLPADWGHDPSLGRSAPRMPRPEDFLQRPSLRPPTIPAFPNPAKKSPLDELATEVVNDPEVQDLGATALYAELTKRAKGKGIKATQYQVKLAIDKAKILKTLETKKK